MKKILIILLFISFSLPVLAEYKPIPKELSKQYKKEIEQVIKSQIPVAKKNIDNVFKEVELEKDAYEKVLKIEYSIEGVFYDLYWNMIDTTEKYIGKNYIRNTLNEDDNPWGLHEALTPYLKDNKINASKIYSLIKYGLKRQKELEKQYNYQIKLE